MRLVSLAEVGFPGYSLREDGAVITPNGAARYGSPMGSQGYLGLRLPMNRGGQQVRYIHRMMAVAFLENPKKCKTVRHLDDNIQNNHFMNLEWTDKRKPRSPNRPVTEEQVRYIAEHMDTASVGSLSTYLTMSHTVVARIIHQLRGLDLRS